MTNDDIIFSYASDFKVATERARDAGLFVKDFSFYNFPKACCGDTCYLLGEYLYHKDIKTIYVCGDLDGQSHAWLVVKDKRIKAPTIRYVEIPCVVRSFLNQYGGNQYEEKIELCNYEETDINHGLIIDITADQFGEPSVYVDHMGDFHKQFNFVAAHDYTGLGSLRLKQMYNTILDFIE
ncbi:MAG: hypothetical protein IJ281_07170 [Clostridia bacterium]|nr:hypothetical protein [Clostridia bacterium]